MNAIGISKKYAKTRRVFMEANWISRYPIGAFFLFAFISTWFIWFLAPLFRGTDRYVFDTLIQIGECQTDRVYAWVDLEKRKRDGAK